MRERGEQRPEVGPHEVDLLLGDPTKAEKTFGWKAKVDVRGLAQMMAKSDFDALG